MLVRDIRVEAGVGEAGSRAGGSVGIVGAVVDAVELGVAGDLSLDGLSRVRVGRKTNTGCEEWETYMDV